MMRAGAVPYDVLILVCTNHRDETDPRGSCEARGSKALQEEMKRRVKALAPAARVRVSQSGCLGLCVEGPNVFVFPPGRGYFGVRLEDVDTILDEAFGRFARPPDPLA